MVFSNWTAKLAQLAQSLKVVVSLAELSIDQVLPYTVANACSTFPFCCGVPGAVNSNVML
jgi:hypothetical protein